MGSDDIVFEDAPALAPEAKHIVDNFKKDIGEPFPGPEDVENLAETPLAYTEICEPMLKELYQITSKRKALETAEKNLKDELKKLAGKERGMIQRGQFGVKIQETEGRRHTDWQRVMLSIRAWAVGAIGEEGKKAIDAIVAANNDPGVPQIRIQPYVVGSEPGDE